MKRFVFNSAVVLVSSFFLLSCGDDNDAPFGLDLEPEVTSNVNVNLDVSAILQIVNENRANGAQCGSSSKSPVSALEWSDELALSALAHSDDMQRNNYFSHEGRNGSSFGQRAKDAGYEGSPVGENIAQGYRSEADVMQGWMDSPGHCNNIMSSRATQIGIARSATGSYWTMVLGRD
ncbi:MAG: CAP domain-containing protein [Bacteroidota bacterium]